MTDLASVILPIHNQAGHIERLVEGYEAALDKLEAAHETILVVNGSTDTSLEIARGLAERYPSVRAEESGRGWGTAVRHGLSIAAGDLVCFANSARTTAEDLSTILEHAVATPGTVVKANRRVRDNWRRRLGSLLYNLECRKLFDLPYFDLNGTPKAFPREFEHLMSLERSDDLIDLEFAIRCRRHGYPVVEIPVISTTRHSGRSTTRLRSAWRMYAGAFRLWREQRA